MEEDSSGGGTSVPLFRGPSGGGEILLAWGGSSGGEEVDVDEGQESEVAEVAASCLLLAAVWPIIAFSTTSWIFS